MPNLFLIGQKVLITKLDCKTDIEIQYYSSQIGIIKGLKTFKKSFTIYLIEFLNHNRIWVMAHELKSYNRDYPSTF